jgi:acyl carrier protein
VTQPEEALAREIRQLAREDLGLEWHGADDDEMAGELDSLALLALLVSVEDHYRVRISDNEAMAARSLADLARLVARKLEAPGLTQASPQASS